MVEGDWPDLRDLVWTRADLIVWLDYSVPTIFWHLVKRTIERLLGRDPLGRRDALASPVLSKESLLVWGLRNIGRPRRRYRALLSANDAPASIRRFRSPRETDRWLRELEMRRRDRLASFQH